MIVGEHSRSDRNQGRQVSGAVGDDHHRGGDRDRDRRDRERDYHRYDREKDSRNPNERDRGERNRGYYDRGRSERDSRLSRDRYERSERERGRPSDDRRRSSPFSGGGYNDNSRYNSRTNNYSPNNNQDSMSGLTALENIRDRGVSRSPVRDLPSNDFLSHKMQVY